MHRPRLSSSRLSALLRVERFRLHVSANPDHRVDGELVRAVLAGEQAAVDALVVRLGCIPRILAALNQRMGSPFGSEDLNDLTQDSLIHLWRRLESYSGQASLETWAYSFCTHGFMNELRKGQRRGRASSLEESQAEVRPVPADTLEFEQLHRGLQQLEDKDARVIRLKYFDDLTFEEIGARLELSPNTAKTCYYRGMRRLAELLRRPSVEVLP